MGNLVDVHNPRSDGDNSVMAIAPCRQLDDGSWYVHVPPGRVPLSPELQAAIDALGSLVANIKTNRVVQ